MENENYEENLPKSQNPNNVHPADNEQQAEANQAVPLREDVIFIQQFTAACVALLELLRNKASQTIEEGAPEKQANVLERFVSSSTRFIDSLRESNFDFQRVLKKVYGVIRSNKSCQMVTEKDGNIFFQRNESNKIISILPGINVRVVYSLLSEEETEYFWQYFHLMVLSTFNVFNMYNPQKIGSQPHVIEMMKELGSNLQETGITIDDRIFNPYLGLGSSEGGVTVESMFENTGEFKTGENLTLDAALNALGIGNIIDEKELDAKLNSLKESDMEIATDKIVNLLGANSNPKTREVCGKLVRNIVEELKVNGIGNVGSVLSSVAQKSRKEIKVNDMKNTMSYVNDFMNNGQDRLKSLTDENGNPIGQNLLNSISRPMQMMKAMGMGGTNAQNPQGPSDNENNK